MKSGRQTTLRESLRGTSGVPGALLYLFKLMERHAYSDMELDLIEKQLDKVPAYKEMIAKRSKDNV